MSDRDEFWATLRDRIDDYLADRLDAVGVADLEAQLSADPEARRYFVRYCRLHTDLHQECRARTVAARALRAFEPVRRPHRISAYLALAAALTLAVGAGWWLAHGERQPEVEPEDVAWLVNAQDCRWAEDGPPVGSMHAGTLLHIEQGLAEVHFRSGARIVLEGPASLELLSGNGARLLRGRLSARVPEQAHGFVVYSPQGKVVDLGTEFGLAVGEDGAADVHVFEGRVDAAPVGAAAVSLTQDQSARLDRGSLKLVDKAVNDDAARFVRSIVAPPVVVPRTLKFDFRKEVAGTLHDAKGRGVGLTHRLPGTGSKLAVDDENLNLDAEHGGLELTTTKTDINTQANLPVGEYLGVKLSDLGFTGGEDFAVAMTVTNIPALEMVGQFGLYAGSRSDKNIRGGVISRSKPGGSYTQNLVNNNGGRDSDSHFVGLFSTGDDLCLTLQRVAGKFTLTVDNRTTKNASTLSIRHPDFLDGDKDLYVGLFGANTNSEVRKTLRIQELTVTVWTVTPRPK